MFLGHIVYYFVMGVHMGRPDRLTDVVHYLLRLQEGWPRNNYR